jgi:aminoethylphosphonate catabolism LysR family transcriptional regulator
MQDNDPRHAGMKDGAGPDQDRLLDSLPYVSFNQLRSFHAVALTGSVTAAARLLHVGQPTVTTQLRQLEASYKVELAHRLPTGIRLTELGRQLFALTESLFSIQSQALALLRGVEGQLEGTLHVGSVAPYFIMRTLACFGEAHPNVKIDLTLNDSATIAQMVADCDVDVAVVGHLGLDSRFMSVPFSRQSLVILVPPDHPWAERPDITLRELGQERMILRKGGSASRRVLHQALAAAGVEPEVALEVDREGALEAVRSGLGITVATTAEISPGESLRVLSISDVDLYTDAFVVCLESRAASPLVTAFLQVSSQAQARPTPATWRAVRPRAQHGDE